jgi:hypothetical protein
MKPKASWIAWGFCGLVCLAAIQNVISVFSNPKPGASFLELAGGQIVEVLIPIVFAVVGALIVSYQPRNMIGWLLFIPAFSLVAGLLLPDVQSWIAAPPPLTLRIYLALWLNGWNWLLLIFPVFLIMLLFPTGRPPSPRWNWVAYLALGMSGVFVFLSTFIDAFSLEGATWTAPNPIGFIPSTWGSGSIFMPLWLSGLLVLAISSLASLVVRYRRAGLVEQEQIKWLFYACGLFGGLYAVWLIVYPLGDLIAIGPDVFGLLLFLVQATIPVAIAIAILRYHLWDIDVIIRRTLVYGGLTVTLALVFFGGVTILQNMIQAVSGQKSAISIVVTTLAIAALFNPLRSRLQNGIDRRFYRKKYDAEKTLESFAQTARGETNLEQLTERLQSLVEDTFQPESVNLWLNIRRNK